MNFSLTSYPSQLLIVSVSLLLYLSGVSYIGRTRGQYETRNVLLNVADYSRASQVADNTVESLKIFYKDILDSVQLQRLPYGYDVKEFRVESAKGTFNLLDVTESKSLDMNLEGGFKLILRVHNTLRDVYGESSCYAALQASHVWDLQHDVRTYPGFNVYDIVLISLLFSIPLIAAFWLHTKYRYCLAAVSIVAWGIEVSKRFPQLTGYAGSHIMRLVSFLFSASFIAVVSFVYKLQADVLGKHDVFHSVFNDIGRNGIMLISLFMLPFLHHIGIHVVYWVIWVPIALCVVMSIVGCYVKYKMDEANRFSKTVVIQDTQDISVETARNKSVLNSTINLPCLILVGLNVLLSVLIMILCFKDSENGSSIETVQNIINTPITTASNHTVFTIGNDLPEMTLRAQVKSKDDSIFIHQAKSTEDIKQWLKGVLSKIHIFNHLCILTDRSNNANAKKVDLAIVDEIFKGQELNDFSFLFMLETSDSELVYFKLDLDRTSLDINNVAGTKIYTLNTNPSHVFIYLGVSLLVVLFSHLFFDLKENNVLGGWDVFWNAAMKVRLGIYLIISMCLIVTVYMVISSLEVFKYIPKLTDHMIKGQELGVVVNLLAKVATIHNVNKLIVFLSAAFLLLYVIVMLPQYYRVFTINGEFIKRTVVTHRKHMGVVVYQIFVMLISWSVVGCYIFGGSIHHFSNIFAALRYNSILGFNKVLVSNNNKYAGIYNYATIMCFYNTGITVLLAICYYYSRTKGREYVSLQTFDKYKDNFKIDIMAKIDDIVGFKLFVKSVEEHKNYLENTDDEVDYCKDFFHRFPRDVPKGVTALNPRMQVHNYLERIKKYLLCTLFLRMKVRTLSSKIESVEKRTIERMPSNEYRRQYITMLKQRLQRTVVAIEKFKVQMEMLIRDHEANLVEISDVFNATMDGMNSDMSLEGFDSDKLTVDVTRLEKFILPPLHLSHISNPSGQSETFLKGTTEFSKCQSSVVENKMTDETRFSSPKKEGAESHREEEVHVSGKTVDSKEAAELPLSKGVGSPSQESVSHGSTNDDLTHSAVNQMSSKLDKEDKTHGDRRVVSSLGDGHKGQKFDDRNATTTGKQNNHGVGLKPSTNEKGRSLDDDLNDTLNTKNTCDITGRRRNQENTESDAMAQITDGDENTPPDVDDVGIFKTSVFGKR